MSFFRNRFVQWFFVLAVAFNLPAMGVDGPLVWVLMAWAVFYPSAVIQARAWKILKFNYFPNPIQLIKGWKRIWPAVNKGPIVTRVSRPRSSRTP